MPEISEVLSRAVQEHRAGNLAAAEQIYRQVLEIQPQQFDALHLMGLICHQTGRRGTAIDLITRALRVQPNSAEAHYNLGKLLQEQDKLDEAVASYQQAVRLKPDYPEAYYNLGNALRDLGRWEEAELSYRHAVRIKPTYAKAYTNLGNVLLRQGRPEEAAKTLETALRLQPQSAACHSNLARALHRVGKLEEAVAHSRNALQLDPQDPEAHNDLGVTVQEQGRLAEAVRCYRRALELKPDYAEAYNNLGNALKDQLQLDEAVACYQRAVELKPDFAEAHNNVGAALKDQGRLDDALACYRRALDLKPDFVGALNNLLFTLHYREGITLKELAEAHAEFERLHAAPLRSRWRPPDNARDLDRPLRLGFLSADLGQHPVGYFLIRALENLDRAAFEAVCYSDRILPDEMTNRFRAASALWRDAFRLSNEQLAEQIRADRIDILFDLAGHTAGNRLLTFARKPAPIQMTWIGYEGTTGFQAMDYLLADRHLVPPEAEQSYREKVLRLPDGYVCFDPPAVAPPVGPLPALATGNVTLGSFNNPAKITPQVVATWARILRLLPQSRLVLKYRGLDSTGARFRFRRLFTERGIAPERVDLLGPSPYHEYLADYRRIDIALDPFPFNGGVTTCEALWMGVPVVACPGETFASRHSLSHLSTVGLRETIARDRDEYCELAVALASDLPRLAALRAGLRARVAGSPLCDGKRFAANLAALLRHVWRQWAGAEPK